MKKTGVVLSCILGFTLTFGGCIAKAQTDVKSYESIFEGDKVIEINIDIEDEDWQDMMDNAVDEKYHTADVTVDGNKVSEVGVRTKGNMTLNSVSRSESDRYSLRVKMDKYVEGQTLLGLDEFVLNNNYADPTYMREYLSYEVLSNMGIITPKCVYANVYVNGELLGLYLCVEAMDDTLIEQSFENTEGNLYKADNNSALTYSENEQYNTYDLKMGDDAELDNLKAFIKDLNSIDTGEKGNIEDILDVDSALKYIAFNYVFANYDSYSGNRGNNYYLYEDNGHFTIIPWDFNMSFGGFMKDNGSNIDSPVSGSIEDFPLVEKLLSVSEYKEQYYKYVKEYVDWLENDFENRVTEIAELIRDYVEADPTKFYTVEQFESSVTYNEDETNDNSIAGEMVEIGENEKRNGGGIIEDKDVRPDMTEGMIHPEMESGQPTFDMNGSDRAKLPVRGNEGKSDEGDTTNENKPQFKGGHGNGGGIGQNSNTGSIINFVRSRVENIKAVLV